jgi:hypothetical protein
VNVTVLPHGRTYSQGPRDASSVRLWHQQKSLKLFLNNFSLLHFFLFLHKWRRYLFIYYTVVYFFRQRRVIPAVMYLRKYPCCPIKNKHPEKRLVPVFGPEIIFGWIIKLLLTSAPWGIGKEHEELRIDGLRIWTKKISNVKQDWTVNDKLYVFIACMLHYRWVLLCTYPIFYDGK